MVAPLQTIKTRRQWVLLQDPWMIEKLAHFDREVIPERRMHAKGWGAYGTFTVTHDITQYTRASIFYEIINSLNNYPQGDRLLKEASCGFFCYYHSSSQTLHSSE